jgi:hypothetical protein
VTLYSAEAAYPAVRVKQVRFTSFWGPESDIPAERHSRYVGPSSPQLDAAWDVLYPGDVSMSIPFRI